MSEHSGQDSGTLRVTIREAAARLGVTEAAVRKRIQRGSLDKEMGQDGKVYVSLNLSQYMSHPEAPAESSALLAAKDETIAILRDQLREEREARRRADTLLARFMDQLPQLEAAESHEEAAESAAEGVASASPTQADTSAQNASEQRPWWRRMFGG